MTHIETENIIVEKEKELKAMLANQNVVEQKKLHIQREILELQLKKKDIEIVIDKSKGLTKQLQIELSLLTKQFWAEKNRGE